MTRENSNKLSAKKEQMKKSKKTEELSKKKKQHVDSDDEGDDFISESDSDEMDIHEYRKFLSKLFPSKHLDKKIEAGEKIKKIHKKLQEADEDEEWETDEDDEEYDDDDDEEENQIITRSKAKSNKNSEGKKKVAEKSNSKSKTKNDKKIKNPKKTKKVVESDEEDEDDEDDEDDEEEYDDDDVEVKGGEKLNIIFTIGGAEDEDEWDEDYDSEDDDDSDAETEDEDVSVSSASSDEDEEDDDDDDVEDDDEDDEEDKKIVKPSKKNKTQKTKVKNNDKTKQEDKQCDENNNDNLIEKLKNLLKQNEMTNNTNNTNNEILNSGESVLDKLQDLLSKENNNKLLKKCIDFCEEDIKKSKVKKEKKMKKQKAKNVRIFRKIIKDKNTMNDYKFFENMEMDNQKKIIKELKEINKLTRVEKPYRMTLLESDIPTLFKGAAMKKINSLKYMEPGSGEFYKIKNWVDTFMRIPFGKFESLPFSIEDGVDKCHEFMENAQKTLDEAVYGLNDAKMQIMQMLGQLLTNPKAIGTAIAIHGPPGTGKTSLVKEGISKILNRPFAFIALGGATDSSFLEGHSYTYEGSTWGKIVQILIDSKCMNPVIYFDELDKISDTPRGEEIAGILTHLTDTSQNSQFHDKYFAEINFDLSKCLFIFSYNDESKVNPILKDRMYRIQTKGYNQKQKTQIANNYLLPKIREQVRFNNDEIIIPDEVIQYLVDTHCNKEDGVRNLKRCLEIIHTKLNLYRLMKPGTNLFEEDMSIKVEFPLTISKDIVDKLIKINKDNISALYNMYV
jgi:ATP-dependent Lon protease